MLRTVNDQPTLWDSILPPELLVLPVELGRVAALLDDPVFFAPFAAYFDARIGRPSIPVETPEPGAGTAFSPTTWSRSVPSQHDIDTVKDAQQFPTRGIPPDRPSSTDRSVFQVEVAMRA